MSIDLLSETRVSLTALARELNLSVSTCWRWDKGGIRGHRLECFSLGGRRYTTREALERFVAATNGESVQAETPRQRERQIELAERRADELGV